MHSVLHHSQRNRLSCYTHLAAARSGASYAMHPLMREVHVRACMRARARAQTHMQMHIHMRTRAYTHARTHARTHAGTRGGRVCGDGGARLLAYAESDWYELQQRDDDLHSKQAAEQNVAVR